MTPRKLIMSTLAIVTASVGAGASQLPDNNDLLTSQRAEKPVAPKVPGFVVENRGIIINPTPQSIGIDSENKLVAKNGFALKDKKKAFSDINFLPLSVIGVPLNVNFGEKEARKIRLNPVSGAYRLTVNKKGIDITAFDQRGAFYALQTLEQILNSPDCSNREIPFMQITDFPTIARRGVVEGFYGNPWSHQTRLSLIDFYGKQKLNTYIYGPKDDPFHSSPNWRKPYPADQASQIHELVEACRKNYVDFVWAIHPGKDIRWNEDDYQNLVAKFNMMYDLGVRAFAIFFDDINGEGTNPVRQAELLNRLNADFVKQKGDVANLMVCPTDYSRLWANPTPNGALATYGKLLDPSIEIFYTGDFVCSDLTKETMDFFNKLVRRPGFYWWNFPVTDYARNFLMQGPAYGLDNNITSKDVAGIVSNPMEHGIASELALYGVADYSWNPRSYNPIDNWTRGIELLMPDAADAYRTFAIHSTDTRTGYRRDESWETPTFRIGDRNHTPANVQALKNEFEKMIAVPSAIENSNASPALISEIRPWVIQLGKLGERGLTTLNLIDIYPNTKPADFWNSYADALLSPEQQDAFNAHNVGTLRILPFINNAMAHMACGTYEALSGEKAVIPQPVEKKEKDAKPQPETPDALTDHNPLSCYTISEPYNFGRPDSTDFITILSDSKGSLSLTQIAADGTEISTTALQPYSKIELDKNASTLRLNGKGRVFEIIP